jgi:hypothetical protein
MSSRIDPVADDDDDDTGPQVSEDKLATLDSGGEAFGADAVPPSEESGERDSEAALFWAGTNPDEQAFYAANSTRELEMWGLELLQAKRVIQRGGDGVWFVDAKGRWAGRRTAWISCGKGRPLTHAEFIERAARHKRVARQQRAA